jgi:glycerol-3-phosphate dehydrogenase subunit C
MMKFEWPLILPESEPVKALSAATRDISEYMVEIAKAEGLAPGLSPIEGGVAVHHACHARAQNMGAKSAELLRMIPDTKIDLIERCSGHGGTFGVMKTTHDVAVKVGRPVFRTAASQGRGHIVSDCPLAAQHIVTNLPDDNGRKIEPEHPIQIMARAFGLTEA